MFKERLFERVLHMQEDIDYRPEVLDTKVELESILNYLQKILSTKQGSTVVSYDFGIPDVTNFHDKSFGEYIKSMEDGLINTITKFEPRLTNIKVIHDKKGKESTIMYFKIDAQLASNTNIPVLFETVINPDGKVMVNE
ncbi:MAG: type VI secretion system baseplate subunit TssE [Helicobacteraceae bacterium]|nr:type VI secretion system baseplate subunit TssE [Helicobacteraceae bacterium]